MECFQPSDNIVIENDGKTASYTRSISECTVYGSKIISCDDKAVYIWKIYIKKMGFDLRNICIGIDDADKKNINSFFANSDGYGYFDSGDIKEKGENIVGYKHGNNQTARSFVAGDLVTIKLNISQQTLLFLVNDEYVFQFEKIERNKQKKYRMAVGMGSSSSVTLTHFIIEGDEKSDDIHNNDTEETEKVNKQNNDEIVQQLLNNIEQQNKEIKQLKANNSTQKQKISELELQGQQKENALKAQIDALEKENVKLKQRVSILEDERKEYEITMSDLKKEIKRLQIKSINIDEFAEWDEDQVLNWIFSIENGLFVKYEHKLKEEIKSCEIKGIDLLQVTRTDIKEFGVSKFSDQKTLQQHIDKLKQINNNNQQNDNDNLIEGNIASTAYI